MGNYVESRLRRLRGWNMEKPHTLRDEGKGKSMKIAPKPKVIEIPWGQRQFTISRSLKGNRLFMYFGNIPESKVWRENRKMGFHPRAALHHSLINQSGGSKKLRLAKTEVELWGRAWGEGESKGGGIS